MPRLAPDFSAYLRWAILASVVVNAASMLTPIINEGDSVTYAALSQHIAVSGNWADLILDGQDWLDKPHFPFWVTALSFKLGGFSAFTYILPGFLFHLLGGYYTYRIGRLLHGRDAALLALLVYVSAFHLMYTSSAVKAEAFLTGCITPACYYWLRFDAETKLKYLLLGALFSAMAVMTKGIFTLITIASGLVCLWLYQRQWRKLISGKWLLALAATMVFTTPELLALYLQFDARPQLPLPGQNAVSGLRFFLWDSQFGRFFNSGPIKNQDGSPLFFVHVFLWAFLPWVAVFLLALVAGVRSFLAQTARDQAAFVFLGSAFFTTFALFSATTFQLDYYTVILFPFAAILCGNYLRQCLVQPAPSRALASLQGAVTLLVLGLATGLAMYVGHSGLVALVLGSAGTLLACGVLLRRQWRRYTLVVFPVLSILVLYAFLELMTLLAFTRYSTPYNALQHLSATPTSPIYVYRMDPIIHRELGLYQSAPTLGVTEPARLPTSGSEYILLARTSDLAQLAPSLGETRLIVRGDWIDHKTGTLPKILRLAKGVEPLEDISMVKVLAR